jgi:hypothetical protein
MLLGKSGKHILETTTYCLIACLLAGCAAAAKDDPTATVSVGRIVEAKEEKPVETYMPPTPSYGTAANAARNVAINDSLQHLGCNYVVNTETGQTVKFYDRNCRLVMNDCVRVWVSTKTPRPTVEKDNSCREEKSR